MSLDQSIFGLIVGVILGYIVGRLHAFSYRLGIIETLKGKVPRRKRKDEKVLSEA